MLLAGCKGRRNASLGLVRQPLANGLLQIRVGSVLLTALPGCTVLCPAMGSLAPECLGRFGGQGVKRSLLQRAGAAL